MNLRHFYRFLFALTILVVVILPYYWAYGVSVELNVDYSSGIAVYAPEIAFSVLGFFALIGMWRGFKLGLMYGFFSAIVVFPALKFLMGSPTVNTWFISSGLMVTLCLMAKYIQQNITNNDLRADE
jgi:hypothetical protein